MKQRVDWLQPMLDNNLRLILFVDDMYAEFLGARANVKIIVVELEDLETIKLIRSAGDLELPPTRNPDKDSLNFLSFMNCKPELVKLAEPHVVTPYIAYIDSGISKVFTHPEIIATLNELNVSNIPLILLPGCEPIHEVEVFPFLWKKINWMLSGGFFIVPKTCVNEWYELHTKALKRFLAMGCITWEVNVWASFVHTVKDRIVWFHGPHNDTMVTGIPEPQLLQELETANSLERNT
jgi:hypothetical protein